MTSRNTGQTSSTQDASRATGRFKRQTSQNLIESFVLDTEGLELGKAIARGGGGAVYAGQYYGQKVAVKEVFTQIQNALDLHEVAHEIQFISRLHSPFVVRFYGISLSKEKHLLIVEEYCECSLKDMMKVREYHKKQELMEQDAAEEQHSNQKQDQDEQQKEAQVKFAHITPLTSSQWLTAALQIAKGVEYCHSQSIAHRDLKPQNLLLDKNGVAKLCDFGIARTVSDQTQQTMMTGGIGTVTYMAPELLDSKHGVATAGVAVDTYAFGMLLWAFLVGEEPWRTGMNSRFAVILKVLGGGRPEIPPETTPGLKQLIEACWAHLPEDRPDFIEVVSRLSDIRALTGELR